MQEEKDMTLDEAEARHEEVMLEMAGIKAQIAAAKAHVHTTGEYADAGWFAKASSALRYKQAEHQRLQLLCGRLRREEKRNGVRPNLEARRERAIKGKFHELVRDELGDELYEWMWEEARRLVAASPPDDDNDGYEFAIENRIAGGG